MVLVNKKGFDYKMQPGDALPPFSLPGTDGRTHSQAEFTKSVLVVAFTCNHCPYVHAAEEAFQQLVGEFGGRVDVVAINSNESENYPEDSFEKMRERDVNYVFLRDESQDVARAFGAECTPHFFVFKDGKLAYQGRLNDAGQDASRATTHELRDALDELVSGKGVSVPLTAAMGCSIKWK